MIARAGRVSEQRAEQSIWRTAPPNPRWSRSADTCSTGRCPLLKLQRTILDLHGRFLGRVDFLWDDCGVVGEADGLEKYALDRESLRSEKLRQERLEQAGLIVIRWGFDDLDSLDRLVNRLLGALRRGRNRPPGSRDWRVADSTAAVA